MIALKGPQKNTSVSGEDKTVQLRTQSHYTVPAGRKSPIPRRTHVATGYGGAVSTYNRSDLKTNAFKDPLYKKISSVINLLHAYRSNHNSDI